MVRLIYACVFLLQIVLQSCHQNNETQDQHVTWLPPKSVITKHVRFAANNNLNTNNQNNRSLPSPQAFVASSSSLSSSSSSQQQQQQQQLEYEQGDPLDKYLKSLEKHGSRLNKPVTSLLSGGSGSGLAAQHMVDYYGDQVYFLDFEMNVLGLVEFEPKTGYVELELQLVYKWWRSPRDESFDPADLTTSRRGAQASSSSSPIVSFYPATKFRDKKSKMFVNNQLHTIGNIQMVNDSLTSSSHGAFVDHQLLDKLDRFKVYSTSRPVDGKLLLIQQQQQQQQQQSQQPQPQRMPRTMFRQFSRLEQNVTARFKCKTSSSSDSDNSESTPASASLDTSRFPFDSHACELELELVPIVTNNNNNNNTKSGPIINNSGPIFLFPFAKINPNTKRVFLATNTESTNNVSTSSSSSSTTTTSFVDLYLYNNKLVQTASNYSLISREWLLKKSAVFFTNASVPLWQALKRGSAAGAAAILMMSNGDDTLDHILMLNRLNDSSLANLIMFNQQQQQQQRATITMRFLVYRRREPQVYVFILPVLLFTLVTFLIFFLPTTTSSEKSLIAFLNFACLLAYNLYLFKLVIYQYEFQRIPLLMQYSNCLMVMQLGVLAYTCLVKSIYHQGFLSFGPTRAASFASLAEHAYRQIAILNYQEMSEHRKRQKQLQLQQHYQYQQQQQQPIYAYECMCQQQQQQQHQQQQAHHRTSIHSTEPPIYGSVEDETTTTNLCEKIEAIGEKCGLVINNKMSTVNASVKLNVPMIKLDDGNVDHHEAMNGVATIACPNNNDDPYLTYNHMDSSVGGVGGGGGGGAGSGVNVNGGMGKCICNSHETDADCSNIIGLSNCDLGHVNCGSGALCGSSNHQNNKSCQQQQQQQQQQHNDSTQSETNKLITTTGSGGGGGGMGGLSVRNGGGDSGAESDFTSAATTTRGDRSKKSASLAKNWLLGSCCASINGSGSPLMMHVPMSSPSPVCEHVRECDTLPSHNHQHQAAAASQQNAASKKYHHYKNKNAQAVFTNNVMDADLKCPIVSHLARYCDNSKLHHHHHHHPNHQLHNHQKNCSSTIHKTPLKVKLVSPNDGEEESHHYRAECGLEGGLREAAVWSTMRNNSSSSSSNKALVDMSAKINLSVNKLFKLEEIYVREKLQRDEWKRKARVCDAICCLLVFFLLIVCSLFIFIILPTVKTASLID